MTPISIQNAFQNHYPGAEDRHASKAEGQPRDETEIQSSSSLHHLEARPTIQFTNSTIDEPEDRTTAQYADSSAIDELEDRTTAQYADSAVYSPADQTTVQSFASTSNYSDDLTTCQKNTPQVQQKAVVLAESKKSIQSQTIQYNVLRAKDFFSIRLTQLAGQLFYSIRRMVDFRQRGANPTRQLAAGISKTSPLPYQNNRLPLDGAGAEGQPSLEEHQKVLRELDHCRLSFAKELARNGKLRDAIALANKISETSRFFRDAQMLTRSWKQL